MTLATVIITAAALIPVVLAGSYCINAERHRCQWTDCGQDNSESSRFDRLYATTKGLFWKRICRGGEGTYLGDSCCSHYGGRCALFWQHKNLWCEPEDAKSVPDYDGPRARANWPVSEGGVEDDKCKAAGGKVQTTAARSLLGDFSYSTCECHGQMFFEGRCVSMN
ncbi:hypothetical protein CDD83_8115 [Cordyceps sp. RAO-2017]|nr:hypothetical protein CDD83_8115 [Cordyceps sp. RAO-2017]